MSLGDTDVGVILPRPMWEAALSSLLMSASVSAMAIGASPSKKLKLCQIYDYIKERFPFYRVS